MCAAGRCRAAALNERRAAFEGWRMSLGTDREAKNGSPRSSVEEGVGALVEAKPSRRLVRARPPGDRLSKMTTRAPALAAVAPATRPARPAPMTATRELSSSARTMLNLTRQLRDS